MAYTQNPPWVDYPNTTTLITAVALQRIEDGLSVAAGVADTAQAGLAGKANTSHTHTASQITDLDTAMPPVVTTRTFSTTGPVVVTTGAHRLYNDTGGTLTITNVRASVGTAPTGAALIVDVNKNGTTIFTTQTNRPTIAVSGFTDTADAIQVSAWPVGEYLTVDVDQIGSTVAGSDLTVTVTTTGA